MNTVYVLGVVVATIMSAGVAMAQTMSASVSESSTDTAPAPGTSNFSLGTLAITATESGAGGDISIASVPITITAGGGASISDVTSCRLFNADDQALTGSVAPSSGSNTFSFLSPLRISGGMVQTLTLRCDISADAPVGGTYVFTAGALTRTASGDASGVSQLAANLNAAATARIGADNALLALMMFSARSSGDDVELSAIPLDVAFSQGAAEGMINNCRVRNLTNLVAPLNSANVGIVQGTNTIDLDSPLTIPAGTTATLAFTCAIASDAPVGGTVSLGLSPNRLSVRTVDSGDPVDVSVGMTADGELGPTSGSVTFSRTATTPSDSEVPGVPDTGAGSNVMLLGLTGLLASLGLFLTMRRLMR